MLHLDSWYAQSHPDEDFAETFAVWLTPDSDWRSRYAGWPALRKLEYMDRLMKEISGQRPVVATRGAVSNRSSGCGRRWEPLREEARALRAGAPELLRPRPAPLVLGRAGTPANRKASRFIHSIRRDVRRLVAEWTGSYQYTIDRVIEDMIERCDELNLRLMLSGGSHQARLHDARHRADHELPALGPAQGGACKKLEVEVEVRSQKASISESPCKPRSLRLQTLAGGIVRFERWSGNELHNHRTSAGRLRMNELGRRWR